MNQKFSSYQILEILKTQLSEKEFEWISSKVNQINQKFSSSFFYISFSTCARFIIKKDIKSTGFEQFNNLELTRLCLLLTIPNSNFEQFKSVFFPIFETADVAEQEALYLSFDFLPFKKELASKFALGISTNIGSVFDKLALNNAYPHKYLSEDSFNQLVIKTIFTDRNILEIVGLKSRLNQELSRMANELLAERKAANRFIREEIVILL